MVVAEKEDADKMKTRNPEALNTHRFHLESLELPSAFTDSELCAEVTKNIKVKF